MTIRSARDRHKEGFGSIKENVEAAMSKRPIRDAPWLERSGNVIQFPLVRAKPKSVISLRRYWFIGGLFSRADREGCSVVDIGHKQRHTAGQSR